MSHSRTSSILTRISFSIITVLALTSAYAGTVKQLGITDLLRDAQLIAHGRIEDRWVTYDQTTDTAYTHFRLRVDDIIKGSVKSDEVVLSFVGGTWGQRTLVISDMHMPNVGEEGVYFIENPSRQQVHPLLGWQQGHFVVHQSEDGLEQVVATSDLSPVYSVAAAAHGAFIETSRGAALGIKTRAHNGDQQLSIDEFKAQLRAMVEVGNE